jgi:hypothetical protein
MTRVVPRPGIDRDADADAGRRRVDEIDTDNALSLPALEG